MWSLRRPSPSAPARSPAGTPARCSRVSGGPAPNPELRGDCNRNVAQTPPELVELPANGSHVDLRGNLHLIRLQLQFAFRMRHHLLRRRDQSFTQSRVLLLRHCIHLGHASTAPTESAAYRAVTLGSGGRRAIPQFPTLRQCRVGSKADGDGPELNLRRSMSIRVGRIEPLRPARAGHASHARGCERRWGTARCSPRSLRNEQPVSRRVTA